MATGVRMEVADHVATLTLDGPDTLNAFSRHTGRQLSEAYRACDADDDVRVVVLTGAGRAFCSGADLAEGAGSFDRPGESFSASPVQPPAWQVRKLVVAAVNGHAFGIGLTLALQCDLRVVAEGAKLAVPQVRFGMLGDAQSHWTLPRLVGRGAAADLLLTGRRVTADEALAMGMVNQVRPAEEVLPTALALAREVATSASPAGVACSKQILWADAGPGTVAAAETEAHRVLMSHSDVAEAGRARAEGRAPRWGLSVTALPALSALGPEPR